MKIVAESTCAILKEHTSSKVYVRTTAVDATIDTLKRRSIAILTGKHGVGKSTIAYQVLLEPSREIDTEEEGDPINKTKRKPLIINTPDQWLRAVNPNNCLIVYLQDFLGSTNLDNGAVECWKRHLDAIYAPAKNCDVRLNWIAGEYFDGSRGKIV
ncbi:uncharacterized protein LOC134272183 [Saccostrea cucullata]|uniref:uncharacterized protein LOC134272183 n=1 Tax=Saccostrea cuccullata TaxID=36930 RepID=UPI002ED548D1